MVTRLKEVDAVTIGMGWTGAIMARELTKAGLNVVALERGPGPHPGRRFHPAGGARRSAIRGAPRIDVGQFDRHAHVPQFCQRAGAADPPHRRIPAGRRRRRLRHSLGRAALALSADRISASAARSPSATAPTPFPNGMTIQDWPVSYDEIEPFYDHFDKICGVSGQAGNVGGKKIDGGNVFEGPRSDHYPNAPIKSSNAGLMYAAAAKSLGYHPFPAPVAIASAPYTNAEGVALGACEYCGFCNRIACETNAKASPNSTILPALRLDPKFEIAHPLLCHQAQLRQGRQESRERDLHRHAQRRGIRAAGRHRAAVVLRVRQRAALLLAGIGEPYDRATGKGVVGKNYAYQFEAGASAFFEDKELNSLLGLGRHGGRDRRLQRRDLRSRRARFLRRRLYRLQHRRRPADRRPHRAARDAGMGLGMEARHREMVPPRRPLQYAGLGLCQPRQFHGPRSDLQGRASAGR